MKISFDKKILGMQHVPKHKSLCSRVDTELHFHVALWEHNLPLAVGRALTFYLVYEIKLLLVHQNLETSIAVFQTHYLNGR